MTLGPLIAAAREPQRRALRSSIAAEMPLDGLPVGAKGGGARAGGDSPPPSGARTAVSSAVVVAGLVGGLYSIGVCIAAASLLFSGPLSGGLAAGAGATLLGTIVIAAVLGARSALACNIGHVQTMSVVVLAMTLGSTAAQVAGPADVRVATAFVIIALATAATAAALLLTGLFRAGRIVKFFPVEVVAGFVAGTGWLLVTGAMSMMTGAPPNLNGWLTLSDTSHLARLAPALALAAIIYAAMRRFRHPFTLVALLLSAIALFYLWLFAMGVNIADATAAGYLPRVAGGVAVGFPFPRMLWQADWAAVAASLPDVATIAAIGLLGALLNTATLEHAARQEADMDSEMKIAGHANLLGALLGAPPGNNGLAISMLAAKLDVRHRGAGLIVAAVVTVAFFFAADIVAHVPRFLNGGLLFLFGFTLLKDWLVDTRRRYSRREWSVVVLIVAVAAAYSFLAAIVAGLVVATLLFAWSYAALPTIRRDTTLADLPSTIERPAGDTVHLADHGRQVKIIQLQGFMFFGTAERLLPPVRDALSCRGGRPDALILDFTHVTDIDSASAAAVGRIARMTAAAGCALSFSGLTPEIGGALERAGVNLAGGDRQVSFPTLDHALEAMEERLLAAREDGCKPDLFLQRATPAEKAELAEMIAGMRMRCYAPGEVILKAGSSGSALIFLAEGRADIVAPQRDGTRLRIRTMAAGTIIGDLSFVLGLPRTADAVAEGPCLVYAMDRAMLDDLSVDAPQKAALLNRLLRESLARKVLAANRLALHLRG